MSTVAIILASNRSENRASSIFTTVIDGERLLDTVVGAALTWAVDEVIVVLGADAKEVEEMCDLSQVSVLVDPEWEEGAAAPLRAVLDLLSRDKDLQQCVIARGDQPGVSTEVVDVLVATAMTTGADAVLPKYRYATGWPVVVSSTMWRSFLGMEGSLDVHDLIASHAGSIEEVWFDHLTPVILESADDLRSGSRSDDST